MKRRFKLEAGFDLSVTVEVDMDKLTPELATEINSFWSGADDVLGAADGDVVLAAVLRSGPYLMGAVLQGYNEFGAQKELDESEGWPPNGEHGIRIIDFEIPDMDADMIDVTEIAA